MYFKSVFRQPAKRGIPAAYMQATLLSYGLFDEIVSGFPVVGLPLLRDRLGLNYDQIGLLFAVATCSAMVLEPIINVLSDRHSKRWWIFGGLLCLILCFVVGAFVSSYGVLLVVFALYYPAVGTAVGLAQATLIDSDPARSVAIMTRWTLLSSVGDVLAPLLVTALVSLQQGWPEICWLAAGLWAILFLLTVAQPFPGRGAVGIKAEGPVVSSEYIDDIDDIPDRVQPGITREEEASTAPGEQGSVSTWSALRQALRNPGLLRWGLLALIPDMVDEVLLGFASLYLHDTLHVSEVTIGWLLTGTLVSSLFGLALLDRQPWLRRVASQAPHRLLIGMAVVVLAGMLLLLTTHTTWQAGLALVIIGLGAAGWYPIAQAQTYAQLPGRSSLVLAITGLGEPLKAALPAIVGLLAAHFGLLAGLAFLGSAPLLMLLALIGYTPIAKPQQ